MLWSDRFEEPSLESRTAQVMLRRGGLVIAFLLPGVMLVVAVWFP